MSNPLKTISLSEFPLLLSDIFFTAMKAGYAENADTKTIKELPGSKLITWQQEDWKVIDTYFVTPQSQSSGGMTIITYGDIPVWMMQYMGQYPKETIPCLKAALYSAYKEKSFFGGRGPVVFEHGDLIYLNTVFENEMFGYFAGEEQIVNTNGDILGGHVYQGMMMTEH